MNFTSKDILTSALGKFFRDRFYRDAVMELREGVKTIPYYRDNLESVIRLVVNKELKNEEPLSLIFQNANIPLDENTDEEAYKWLYLMLINSLGDEDAMIIEY